MPKTILPSFLQAVKHKPIRTQRTALCFARFAKITEKNAFLAYLVMTFDLDF